MPNLVPQADAESNNMFRLLRFLPSRWYSLSAWKSWTSYMHWRLETFGVYYPDGKLQPPAFQKFLRQFPSYYRWLGQISAFRRRPLHGK